jgi:hypothetical protein
VVHSVTSHILCCSLSLIKMGVLRARRGRRRKHICYWWEGQKEREH